MNCKVIPFVCKKVKCLKFTMLILFINNGEKMLSIGQKFPEFNKLACVSIELGKEFGEVTSEDHKKDGKWMVMFWYPKILHSYVQQKFQNSTKICGI